jgi:hypothetical protein
MHDVAHACARSSHHAPKWHSGALAGGERGDEIGCVWRCKQRVGEVDGDGVSLRGHDVGEVAKGLRCGGVPKWCLCSGGWQRLQ